VGFAAVASAERKREGGRSASGAEEVYFSIKY